MHPAALQNLVGEGRITRHAFQHSERGFHRANVIFRQRARIRSRIRQHLVLFVKRLRQAERVLRAETEARVRVALQARQIVKQRRHRGRRLAFFRDDARLAETFRADRFGLGLVPDALGFELLVVVGLGKFFIEPAAGVIARRRVERADDFPEIARHELADLRLALDQNRQRRRLHAAHGRLEKAAELGIERRHRARAVDAHQPVGLAAAHRGVGQRLHGFVAAQLPRNPRGWRRASWIAARAA